MPVTPVRFLMQLCLWLLCVQEQEAAGQSAAAAAVGGSAAAGPVGGAAVGFQQGELGTAPATAAQEEEVRAWQLARLYQQRHRGVLSLLVPGPHVARCFGRGIDVRAWCEAVSPVLNRALCVRGSCGIPLSDG
jgi:hypothetical protein